MKILYGVQGTGNGHITRARMMARHFEAKNAEVDFIFSGRHPDDYFDMECFGNFQTFNGLTFVTSDGAIDYLKTVSRSRPITFLREIRSLNVAKYDLIVTDFEPISAWAGRLANKQVIGIGHQYAFHHHATPYRKRHAFSKLIMRLFAPASTSVGLHWSDFGGHIVPPIIDPKLSSQCHGSHVVVYLPFEDQTRVSRLLNAVPDIQFIQYSPELTDATQGNVELRRTSHDGFKADLQSCRGVICNSGFELISECLYLGKPILTRPVSGQAEQHANALALRELGYASVMETLSLPAIEAWLGRLPEGQAISYPDVAESLVDWLLEGNLCPKAMTESLWSQTRLA